MVALLVAIKLGRIWMEVIKATFYGIIDTSVWENLESNENFRHNQCPHQKYDPGTSRPETLPL
jgi:hypothetical protein